MQKMLLKIGLGTFYQTIGKMITAGLGFISIIFLTRYLGIIGYGNYTLVFAYLSFFTTFADLGLQTQVIKELTHAFHSDILGTFFWLKIGLTLVSNLLAVFLLLFFHYPQVLNLGIILGTLAVSLGSITGYANTIFQAHIKLGLLTITDVLTKIVTVISIILCIYLHLNFYYLIISVAIGNLFGLIFAVWSSAKLSHFSLSFQWKIGISLLRKSILLGLATVLSTVYFRLDTIMLSVLKGAHDVGIYSLAYKVFENMLVIWWFYLASFYPLLSKFHGNKEFVYFKKLIMNSVRISVIYSLFMIILGIFGGNLLVRIFGGNAFNPSVIPLQILVFSSLFFFITSLFYYYYFLKNMLPVLFICIGISLLFNFIMNLLFIPRFGYIAASWITVATEAFLTLTYVTVWYIKKKNVSFSSFLL